MNPLYPSSFNHKTAFVNGITMHYVDEGAGPITIICVHGFPDLWYGWRYQVPFLVSLGYRVIVPDMRGYGQTDAPSDYKQYTAKNVVLDLVSLLDLLGIPNAVWAGHDWGGTHVWRAAMWYPQKVIGVIAFCTPFSATPPKRVSLENIATRHPNWSYQLYLRREETIKELDANIALFMSAIFRGCNEQVWTSVFSTKLPISSRTITDARGIGRGSLLSSTELDYYISEYKRNGMTGPTNYYRVHEINWEQEHEAGFSHHAIQIDKPCMMVTTGKDAALPAAWSRGMEKYIPHLMRFHIEESAHWVLVEQRNLSNVALKQYLDRLFASDRPRL